MAVSNFSNRRPTGPFEVASGIDTLVVSLRGELPEALAFTLSDAKSAAVELNPPIEVIIGGEVWQVLPRSFGLYPFSLTHEYGFIGITDSKQLPTVRWQPRAEFLHALGPVRIAQWLINQVVIEIGPVTTLLSRIDLHADFQDVLLTAEQKESFICRARSCKAVWDEGVFSGLTFGNRSSRTISARIYDKTLEVSKKGGTYWYDMWGSAYDPEGVVWRTEFEFHRGFLRKFGINTLDDGFASVGGLWHYATEEWLSLRIQTLDETHSRWPVHQDWVSIQGATLSSNTVPLERVRVTRRDDALHKTIPQVSGWTARLAALMGLKSSDELVQQLPQILEIHERSSKIAYDERIRRKRKELGLP